MSLVTTKQLLLDAQKGGYAIGAFNVENMEMVQAVVAAAEETRSPVILQTPPLYREVRRLRLLLRQCPYCCRARQRAGGDAPRPW